MSRLATRAHHEAPAWVISYADVMSLLLVLFIFLCGTGRFPLGSAEDRDPPLENVAYAAELSASEFQSIESAGIPDEPALLAGAPLLVSVFFDRGSSTLPGEAMELLQEAAPLLARARRPLVVVGHVSPLVDRHETLPQPEAHDRAFARALTVVAFLESLENDVRSRPAPELIPASAGHHGGELQRLGADLRDGRDRVDIYPLGVPRRVP